MRSPLALLTVVFILATAGTAMAAFGAATFVSTGDDGAATARGAQQPLGTLSATPRPDTGGGDVGDTRGEFESSAPGEGNGAVANSPSNVVAANSSSKLPFTGLLAIPVLLAGAGLLATGMVVRRRAAEPAASS